MSSRIGVPTGERYRTHWAIKDGQIPQDMMRRLRPSYDVVFSFAGEERIYVKKVADFLKRKGVRVFYDDFERTELWGKDLVEHFDLVYRLSGKYCVIFISKNYKSKLWTTHERRAACARAFKERGDYILPARFDDTEIDGILPTRHFIELTGITPGAFGKIILKKLGRTV